MLSDKKLLSSGLLSLGFRIPVALLGRANLLFGKASRNCTSPHRLLEAT